MQYHPDVKPGQEVRFKQISEAYATLGHADSRRLYDSSANSSSSFSEHHGSSPSSSGSSSYFYPDQDVETSSTRRARANYAWEHNKRTNPRYTSQQRRNPFSYQYGYSPEQDHFDRMQAREAWKAANISSGARRRMEYEAERIIKEENLRNTSGIIRAVQAVGMISAVLWFGGVFRASAWEGEASSVLRDSGNNVEISKPVMISSENGTSSGRSSAVVSSIPNNANI